MTSFKEILTEMENNPIVELDMDLKKKLGMGDFKPEKKAMKALGKKYGSGGAKNLKKVMGDLSVEDLLNLHKYFTDVDNVDSINAIDIELLKRSKKK